MGGYIIWTAVICAVVGLILNDIVFARKARKAREVSARRALEDTLSLTGVLRK